MPTASFVYAPNIKAVKNIKGQTITELQTNLWGSIELTVIARNSGHREKKKQFEERSKVIARIAAIDSVLRPKRPVDYE